jgi:hypothetical protein
VYAAAYCKRLTQSAHCFLTKRSGGALTEWLKVERKYTKIHRQTFKGISKMVRQNSGKTRRTMGEKAKKRLG